MTKEAMNKRGQERERRNDTINYNLNKWGGKKSRETNATEERPWKQIHVSNLKQILSARASKIWFSVFFITVLYQCLYQISYPNF